MAQPMERADGAPADRDAALRYVDGDRVLLAELVAAFTGEYPERRAILRAATAGGDRGGIERAAHSLKAVLAFLGARRARDLAGDLERIGREGGLAEASAALERLEAELDRVVACLGGWT